MTSQTYIKTLSREWGGYKTEHLQAKLMKLRSLIISEMLDSTPKVEEPKKDAKEFNAKVYFPEKYKHNTPESSLFSIIESNLKLYDKALSIVKLCELHSGYWFKFNLVPEYLFMELWKFIENEKFRIEISEDDLSFRYKIN